MSDVLIQALEKEPVTVAEAKAHERITAAAEDTLVRHWIQVARLWCEDYTRRAFLTQQRRLTLDAFPGCIRVPRSPLRSVESIRYLDTDGQQQTLDTARYRIDTDSEPGRIVPAWGESWPAARALIASVTVAYTAGYGDEAEAFMQTEFFVLLVNFIFKVF